MRTSVARWVLRAALALLAGSVAMPVACAAAETLFSTPLFRTLGVEDGLPATRTVKLAEDKDGFLWAGTRDGLARYDGTGFRVWRHDPAQADSLSGNSISALYVDRGNRLWVSADDVGLNRLDPGREHVRQFRHDPANVDSLADNDVWAIAEDSADATLWFGTASSGLDHLLGDGRFVHLRHVEGQPQSLSSDTVLSLYFDTQARLWIGTDQGLDLRQHDGELRHIEFPGAASLQVRSIGADQDGSVLLGTDQGVWRVGADLQARLLLQATLPSAAVFATQRDALGELWVGTTKGLARQLADGTLVNYAPNPALPGSLTGSRVFDMLADHEHGLWFALVDGGIAHLPPQWRNFSVFRAEAAAGRSVGASNFVGLAADPQQGLWSVSVTGAVDRLDPRSGAIEHYAERLPLQGLRPLSVLADARHRLWIGHRQGVAIFDLDRNTMQLLPLDPKRADALAPGVFDQLLACVGGTVWASARGSALYRIDAETAAITRYAVADSELRSVDIRALRCDPQDRLWLAHAEGVQFFDAGVRRFVSPAGAPKQRVHALSFAADGTLWLHRLGALEHYRVVGEALEPIAQISASDGWPAIDPGGMAIDAAGRLWVSSSRGLFRIDPWTRAIRQFDSRDGLSSTEFADGALVRGADGLLFAANLAGVVAFDPARFAINPVPPPLHLDEVSISRDAQRLRLPLDGTPLTLRWNDRDLRVEAHALSFANPAGNRYQYQLIGYDPDWIDNGNRGAREFGQLPAGDYDLRLRAANADGVWSAATTPLRIEVQRAPWLRPLAYAGYALLAALLLLAFFLGYRSRVQRRHQFALAEQQRRWAEQASAAKSGFLADMGHEIRTPMTGVLGMTELLLRTPLDPRQRGYAETIAQSGSLMLRLVNDALDLARIEAGRFELDLAPFELPALLREVHALEQPLALQKNLDFELRIAADAPRRARGDRLRVKQILLNLCNNALKFCERGSVGLALRRTGDGLVRFDVYDTGPGMSEELRDRLFQRFEQADGSVTRRYGGSGLGLAICRELVECMHGTIAVESTLGLGTAFSVRLPLPEIIDEIDDTEPMAAPDSAVLSPSATAGEAVADGDIAAADAEVASAPDVAAAAALPLPHIDSSRPILLVEDDATVARVIIGLLEAQGHRVHHAANGLVALSALEHDDSDCVLLDLDLPGIDGLQFARLLREREASANRPRRYVIAITARSGGDEQQRALEAGMDGFLRKPISGAQLAEAIAAVARDQSFGRVDDPSESGKAGVKSAG